MRRKIITDESQMQNNVIYLTKLEYLLQMAYRRDHFFDILFCETNKDFTINIVF